MIELTVNFLSGLFGNGSRSPAVFLCLLGSSHFLVNKTNSLALGFLAAAFTSNRKMCPRKIKDRGHVSPSDEIKVLWV